ncbi:hypothetical protein MtrunA17_Chr8g0376721 [Medicago truncatula]|uniref:DUF7392 domain-containing protein n=1 Tax=Medicago truncatula TaxID=3880 RepID=A0A072U3V5_MEDTR|nr:uncharacterized protein LOC25501686 isoform X1 [Medicago truncatula]KEH20520.1 hypothetical protein MTR_8g079475 [Medicago truncatula]RHN42424.1 hypothetical protein MtrunA17_Chr8g0376721 [Medicago truncatula]
MVTCCIDFSNKDLEISFFVFKPTVVIVDRLIHEIKQFSSRAENLGCVQSSILKSIHGNMIIWFGAWQKRSYDEKDKLTADLLSILIHVTRMAVLVEHYFLNAYAGESRDGSSTINFSTGDIISMNSILTNIKDLNDLCYAILAIFRSRFSQIQGKNSGLCLKGQKLPNVVCIHVWKSLQFCYSWILNPDYRNWMIPYLERFSINMMKYDIFRVVYVSGDNIVNLPYDYNVHEMLENEEESRHGHVMQN